MADEFDMPAVDEPDIISQVEITTDGKLQHKKEKTNDEILKEFYSWDEVNNTLLRACSNGVPPNNISVESANETVTAVFDAVKQVDALGKATRQGTPCAVCGKHVKYMPGYGYCSVQCFMKDALSKIAMHKAKPNPYQEYIDAIQSTLDFLNMIMNTVMELPQKLKDIAKLPPEYAAYLTLRINIIFLKLRITINQLMIYKNNCIILLLKPMKLGIINDKLQPIIQPINTVLQTIQQLQVAMNASFEFAMNMMKTPMLALGPGSYAWTPTPRSLINIPDKPLYIEVPNGAMFTGTLGSPLNALNLPAIAQTVQNAFPPIIPLEYFMEPEMFDVRLACSDQGDIVKQVIQTLELTMKFGAEYIPRYKDLSLTNPWFIIAIVMSWGPMAKLTYGSPINPMV